MPSIPPISASSRFSPWDENEESLQVAVHVVNPEPDIDTDSNNNGHIDFTQAEDDVEADIQDQPPVPGNILRYNNDDDNGNGVEDLNDTGPFTNSKGERVIDDELEEIWVTGSTAGANLTGSTLSFNASNVRVWDTPDKKHDITDAVFTIGFPSLPYPFDCPVFAFADVGPDKIVTWRYGRTFYVEGLAPGAAHLEWILTNRTDDELNRDKVVFTVAQMDLDACTIDQNVPTGLLDDSEEMYPGAWVPRNDDDDDYDAANTADYAPGGPIVGENDLLPIVLHPIEPASLGGTYSLVFAPVIRIWSHPDRTGEVSSITTTFDATVETTLYVEGVTAGASAAILMDWQNAGTAMYNVDCIIVSVFSWVGPLNVPGYSIYKYRATGGMAGAGQSMWVTPVAGTLHASASSDQQDEGDVLWDSGAVVGMAVYQAAPNYIWGLDVNVVQIEIGTSTASAYGSPVQNGGAGGAQIQASNQTDAMTADIIVHTVKGPLVNGVERGKKFMELGLSHQARFDAEHGLYNNTTPPKRRRASLEDGAIHWDVAAQSTIPWTFLNAAHHLNITSDATVISNYQFSTYDNPKITATDQFVLNGDQVDVLVIEMHHWVPLIVRTKDTRVIDGIDVRTERAMLEWNFDGTGSVDANGVWSLAGGGVTVPVAFTEIRDGRRLPDAQANLNEAFAGRTWITENQ